MRIDRFLSDRGVSYELIPHRDTYGAQRLAQQLHVSGREVAKTVLLRADRGFAYLVAVLPANRKIDFELLSEALGGSRVEMATELEIKDHCPDCEFATLPPFGSQYGMRTVVDRSMCDDAEIVFDGNNHHEAIRMTFDDFREIEQPLMANFTSV